MLFMILYALRIISLHKTLNFVYFLQKPDIHTDGPTDIPSYRDAIKSERPFLMKTGVTLAKIKVAKYVENVNWM